MFPFLGPKENEYLIDLILSLFCGFIIGAERESKNKPAGISTQTLVMAAAMTFTFLSKNIGTGDQGRIAAQIVTGVGFLGAGVILKSEAGNRISNLTTAASIWYAAAVGMALGFNFTFIAIAATIYAALISRIPHINKLYKEDDGDTVNLERKKKLK